MFGATRSSADLNARQKQILIRAWRRGLREVDILLGTFADVYIKDLSESEITDFENLLNVPDRDVLTWMTGEQEIPENYNTAFLQRLRAFHQKRLQGGV